VKLVAAMHQPAEVNRAAEALAKAVGLTPAEAQFRLAAAPPSMLARLDDEAAAALIRELDPLGLGCVSCNFPVPDDQARTIARTVTFEPLALVCAPRAGKPLPLRYDELRPHPSRAARWNAPAVKSSRTPRRGPGCRWGLRQAGRSSGGSRWRSPPRTSCWSTTRWALRPAG